MTKKLVHTVSAAIAFCCASSVALGHNVVTGLASNANIPVASSTAWTVVKQATVTIPVLDLAIHDCVINASADMDHEGPPGIESHYRFTLARNTTNPAIDGGAERTVELVNNTGIEDPDSFPVATTLNVNGLTRTNGVGGGGSHTFYFLGRKVQATDVTANVLDASLSVICVQR